MFFLYLYGGLGLLTAAGIAGIIILAMMIPGPPHTWRDYAWAAGVIALSFIAWPVYIAGISYSLWRGQ